MQILTFANWLLRKKVLVLLIGSKLEYMFDNQNIFKCQFITKGNTKNIHIYLCHPKWQDQN